jgi:hypothetical protein
LERITTITFFRSFAVSFRFGRDWGHENVGAIFFELVFKNEDLLIEDSEVDAWARAPSSL